MTIVHLFLAEDSPEFHQKARSYNQQHLNNDVDFQIWEELERAGKLFAEVFVLYLTFLSILVDRSYKPVSANQNLL